MAVEDLVWRVSIPMKDIGRSGGGSFPTNLEGDIDFVQAIAFSFCNQIS